MMTLFVINWLMNRYVSNWMMESLGNEMWSKIVEAMLRTGIIVVFGLTIIYYTKISKEINEIINKVFHHFD